MLLWTYQDMADGTPFYLRWLHDDAPYQEETMVWNADTHGTKGQAYFASLAERDGDSLPPGNYRLVLFIGERQVQEATFEILPRPSPTSPPSRAAREIKWGPGEDPRPRNWTPAPPPLTVDRRHVQ